MTKEKELCCPHCGSDDLAFEAWVDEHKNFLSDGVGYALCNNAECECINEEITPVNKGVK